MDCSKKKRRKVDSRRGREILYASQKPPRDEEPSCDPIMHTTQESELERLVMRTDNNGEATEVKSALRLNELLLTVLIFAKARMKGVISRPQALLQRHALKRAQRWKCRSARLAI